MGLDVYLYKYDRPLADVKRGEEECSAATEAIWEREMSGRGFDDLSEEERDRISALCRAEEKRRGLGEYGESPAKTKIEEPSKVYPDHYFKVGYLRSSYNEGGFDRVVGTAIGKTLADIFEPGERSEFVPNWKACLKRAVQVRDALAKACEGECFTVTKAGHNQFIAPTASGVTDSESALNVFRAKRKEWAARSKGDDFGQNYSCREGTFLMTAPLKVYGIVEGVARNFTGGVRPMIYLVHEVVDRHEWYRHASEIVVEMIEWVLGQPDPKAYVLHWSG